MTEIPEDLRYSAEHEWVRAGEDGLMTIGITAHAVEELGDIVYLELPKVGAELAAGSTCGEVESTKAVSELFSPLSGEVVEINEAMDATPEVLNEDPYGAGWLFRMRMTSEGPLLDAAGYGDLISS